MSENSNSVASSRAIFSFDFTLEGLTALNDAISLIISKKTENVDVDEILRCVGILTAFQSQLKRVLNNKEMFVSKNQVIN